MASTTETTTHAVCNCHGLADHDHQSNTWTGASRPTLPPPSFFVRLAEPECRFPCSCHDQLHGSCNFNGGCDCPTLRRSGRLNDGTMFRPLGTVAR